MVKTLEELRVAYVNGAFKIIYDENSPVAELSGYQITAEQASVICQQFGWTRISESPFKVMEKTAKFIRGFKSYLKTIEIWKCTFVSFENTRISNELKYYERIKLVNQVRGFDLTLTCGMPGTNCTYALYDKSKDIARPVFSGRSMKQIVEYIDNNY